MKWIKLLRSAYVGGDLRHPSEGVLHVSDAEAARVISNADGFDVSDDFTDQQEIDVPLENLDAIDPALVPANPLEQGTDADGPDSNGEPVIPAQAPTTKKAAPKKAGETPKE